LLKFHHGSSIMEILLLKLSYISAIITVTPSLWGGKTMQQRLQAEFRAWNDP
jgi:hypothetical protein